MAKPKNQYICQSCGTIHPRWAGQCDGCSEWNTITEQAIESTAPLGAKVRRAQGKTIDFVPLKGKAEKTPRTQSDITEFDRVTGGGLVDGSVILIGGDPGIGKSTLLLQVTANLSRKVKVAYISGEESIDQVRMRAGRLGIDDTPVQLASITSVSDIVATMDATDAPQVIVVDSIQTMFVDAIESAPGTVSQVRASAQELIRMAKKKNICVLIVGHVTKEGNIAGPRILEHMVDTVLYFEGERGHQFRILRGVKNRFGATDEIGVFDMTEQGLAEVPNPSALLLENRNTSIPGTVVFAGVEGTRPLLVEIQALVSPSHLATPRRAVVGWDVNRLHMILAVLESRAGVSLVGNDIYLNVAGGLRITEPAADLAVAIALVSAVTNTPIDKDAICFGEMGLTGEIRSVSQTETRLKEAEKLGFAKCMVPPLKTKSGTSPSAKLSAVELKTIADISKLFTFEQ